MVSETYGSFAGCINLKQVVLPESVVSISIGEFEECTNLETIYLPSRITEIPQRCFYNCIKLNNVIIPPSVDTIGKEAFAGCKSLNKIDIRARIKSIYLQTFRDCTSLEEFVVPNSVTDLWGGIFWGCTNLKKVVIPPSVTNFEITPTTSDMGRIFDSNSKNVTLYVVKDSEAEIYAINNDMNYELYEEPTLTIKPIPNQIYTGTAIRPKPFLKYGQDVLQEGRDYTLAYTNNIHVGTAQITITAMGSYTGRAIATFRIVPKSILTCNVPKTVAEQSYTGSQVKPNITIKNGRTVLRNGIDYIVTYKNNTNLGTATMTIRGIGDYTGTITKTFKILVKQVKNVAVSVQTTSQVTVKWSKDAKATGYEVYMATSKNGKYKKVATITKNSTISYKKTKLSAGKTYYFKVRVYKTIKGKKNYGAYSQVLETATKTKTPSISKATAGKKKVTLKWKKVSGATGYEVYMSTSKSKGYKKIATNTKNSKVSYTKTNLKSKKKYYFKIRTYKTVAGKKIYSSYSSVKSVKVK